MQTWERPNLTVFFVQVLTNLGEKLDESEVDELLKDVEVGKDGRINYVGKWSSDRVYCTQLILYLVDFVTIVLSN